jgi:hypothetical protein
MATVKSVADDEEEQGPVQLGSEAGAAPGGGGMAQAGAPAQNNFTKSNFVSGKTILEKNKQAPVVDLTADIQKKTQAQRDVLGKKQSEYDQGLGQQVSSTKLDRGAIEAGARGDTTQFNRINQLLSGAPQVQDFDAGTRGINIQDATALNTSAGVEAAMKQRAQQEGRAGYTQGQASLDAALFGRSAEGRGQVQRAAAEKAKLDSEIATARDAAAAKKSQAMSQIGANQQDARTQLQDFLSGIDTRAKERVAVYNSDPNRRNQTNRRAEGDGINKDIRSQAQQIEDRIAESIGQKDRTMFDRQNFAQDLLGKYIKTQDYNPLYEAEDAQQFNRIAELLGSSDRREAGGGKQADTFDEAGYQKAIEKRFGGIKKGAAENKAEARLQQEAKESQKQKASDDLRTKVEFDKAYKNTPYTHALGSGGEDSRRANFLYFQENGRMPSNMMEEKQAREMYQKGPYASKPATPAKKKKG